MMPTLHVVYSSMAMADHTLHEIREDSSVAICSTPIPPRKRNIHTYIYTSFMEIILVSTFKTNVRSCIII